jgi:hypothetical protein
MRRGAPELTDTAKLLIVVSAFIAGYEAAQDAAVERRCDDAKRASEYLALAQRDVPSGLDSWREPAGRHIV